MQDLAALTGGQVVTSLVSHHSGHSEENSFMTLILINRLSLSAMLMIRLRTS